MNLEEKFAIIRELEKRYPVDEWQIDDVDVWPILRKTILDHLHIESYPGTVKKKSGHVVRLFSTVTEQLKAIFNDFRNNASVNRSDILFFTHTTCRTSVRDGARWDGYCGEFEVFFKEQSLEVMNFEWAPFDEYRLPRWSPSKYVQSQLLFYGKLWQLLDLRRGKINLPLFDDFVNHMRTDFRDWNFLSLKWLSSYVKDLKGQSYYWDRILRRVRPKIIFVVTYYGLPGYALTFAGKKLGIPAVDIQHGVQGDYHQAYGSWTKVKKTGYNVIPDMFWVWSDSDRRSIADSFGCNENLKVLVGGNLNFRKRPSVSSSQKDDDVLNILVTLQPGIDLLKSLDRLFSESQSDVRWWIRLHPSMKNDLGKIEDHLRSYKSINTEVRMASERSLADLLQIVNLHITFYSSVIIEAASFGVPSIALGAEASLLYKDYITSGFLRVLNENEISVAFLKQMKSLKRGDGNAVDSDEALNQIIEIVNSYR